MSYRTKDMLESILDDFGWLIGIVLFISILGTALYSLHVYEDGLHKQVIRENQKMVDKGCKAVAYNTFGEITVFSSNGNNNSIGKGNDECHIQK